MMALLGGVLLIISSVGTVRAESVKSLDFYSEYIDLRDASAKACIDFNAYLDPNQSLTDVAEISPTPSRLVQYRIERYDGLCISGLDYNQDYTIVVKSGLRGEDGERLLENLRLTISVGERDPDIMINARNYILPMSDTPRIPISVVNQDVLQIDIARILPQNITSPRIRDKFRNNSMWGDVFEELTRDYGERVWRGEINVDTLSQADQRNQNIDKSIPLDMMKDKGPGLYIVGVSQLDEANPYKDIHTMWLVRSDIGLTTYQGSAGLYVSTRSLDTAEPKSDVALTLLARNNAVLATATTSAEGIGSFSAESIAGVDGFAPHTVIARQDDDLNFVAITSSPIDLADRGVTGRAALAPMNVYAYTERSVYRRGESINTIAMLRTDKARAIGEFPLQARIVQPDQTVVHETVLTDAKAGGYHLPYTLPASAQSGRWVVEFFATASRDKPIGKTSFLVADIVPPRIEVTIDTPTVSAHDQAQPLIFDGKARYLFGAPAGGLTFAGELTIRPQKTPFAGFEAFSFGNPYGHVQPSRVLIDASQSDDKGAFQIRYDPQDFAEYHDLTVPAELALRAEVRDTNGRATTQRTTIPLATESTWVGLRALTGEAEQARWQKSDEEDERVKFSLDQSISFEAIALSGDGQRTQLDDVHYRLVEQDYFSQWMQQGDRWVWSQEYYDVGERVEDLAFDANGMTTIELGMLDWGGYRLEVIDAQQRVLAAIKFDIGWGQSDTIAGTPDVVELSSNKALYQKGERAVLNIESPFTGHAQVMVATATALSSVAKVKVAANEEVTVELPVGENWGAGAYVLVTAYRPHSVEQQRGPDRAMGVLWLATDVSDKALSVRLDAPEQSQSQRTMSVTVNVDGAQNAAYVTLAAVDEGVLQLDDFSSPSPLDFFFSQYRLAFDIRDIYSYLINPYVGEPAEILSGGDGDVVSEAADEFAVDSDIEISSYFSGIVPLSDGQASIDVPIGRFNGEMRLMAVAWDEARYGESEDAVSVQDPVVVQLSKPRFLNTDDTSELQLQLFNLEHSHSDFTLSLRAIEGGLVFSQNVFGMDVPAKQIERQLVIPQGEQVNLGIPIQSSIPGRASGLLVVESGDDFRYTASFTLGVRPAYTPVSYSELSPLSAAKSQRFLTDAYARLKPETITSELRLQPSPTLGAADQLAYLDRYPYGCLEQVTSTTMPLLGISPLASRLSYEPTVSLDQAINSGINQLIEKQQPSGAFGLWERESSTSYWGSVYAIDFLWSAQQNGYQVPADRLQSALRWLLRESQRSRSGGISFNAYGQYVLAKSGMGNLEHVHQHYRAYKALLDGRVEAALFAAAFAKLGDNRAAEEAFKQSFMPQRALTEEEESRFVGQDDYSYSSSLRDQAMRLALILEAGYDDATWWSIEQVIVQLSSMVDQSPWLSTQERAWLLRAAIAINAINDQYNDNQDVAAMDTDQPLRITLNGQTRDVRLGESIDVAELIDEQGIEVSLKSDAPIWAELTLSGVTQTPPSAQAQGIKLTKTLLNSDRSPADLDALAQGEIYFVHIEGVFDENHDPAAQQPILLVDYLPVGFEIENAEVANSAGTLADDWLDLATPADHIEARDDRFIAALSDMARSEEKGTHFSQLYVVRAVSKGEYIWPNAVAENMITPAIRGNTQAQDITIR